MEDVNGHISCVLREKLWPEGKRKNRSSFTVKWCFFSCQKFKAKSIIIKRRRKTGTEHISQVKFAHPSSCPAFPRHFSAWLFLLLLISSWLFPKSGKIRRIFRRKGEKNKKNGSCFLHTRHTCCAYDNQLGVRATRMDRIRFSVLVKWRDAGRYLLTTRIIIIRASTWKAANPIRLLLVNGNLSRDGHHPFHRRCAVLRTTWRPALAIDNVRNKKKKTRADFVLFIYIYRPLLASANFAMSAFKSLGNPHDAPPLIF